jgi:hypothetical protein
MPDDELVRRRRADLFATTTSDPVAILLARSRQGLYGSCGVALIGILGGAFVLPLTPMAIFTGLTTALLCGACGVIVEIIERSRVVEVGNE